MEISPDTIIYWQKGVFALNATIAHTWIVIVLLTVGSWLVTRRLSSGTGMSRWQNLLEVIVDFTRHEIREISHQDARQYLPFVGTLFMFLLVSNVLAVVPGFHPPTASLSTTAALAACVFVAVPIYGVTHRGLLGYLKNYVEPTPFMLPFNVIGELSRTIALAFRLYGNMMSGTMIVGILLALTPLFFPVVMNLLGLITGVIQAYIFAVLAMVYIAAGTRTHETASSDGAEGSDGGEEPTNGNDQPEDETQRKNEEK